METAYIIVAGGRGARMQAETPKQFLLLANRPVLMHTLEHLHTGMPEAPLVLVLPEEELVQWKALCAKYAFLLPHSICIGGANRFESVKQGLMYLESNFSLRAETRIGIHDGVRPLIDKHTINRAFQLAEEKGSAVPVVESRDSLRLETPEGKQVLDRKQVFAVQTPQVFLASHLLKAYEKDYQEAFTDDATVIENSGYPLHFFAGDPQNIKLTYPIDLLLAELLLKQRHE